MFSGLSPIPRRRQSGPSSSTGCLCSQMPSSPFASVPAESQWCGGTWQRDMERSHSRSRRRPEICCWHTAAAAASGAGYGGAQWRKEGENLAWHLEMLRWTTLSHPRDWIVRFFSFKLFHASRLQPGYRSALLPILNCWALSSCGQHCSPQL